MSNPFARWADEHYAMAYPEAIVRLIDALRDYIRADKETADDLLRGGQITQAEYKRGHAEMQPFRLMLKKLESQLIDPSLCGLIGSDGFL